MLHVKKSFGQILNKIQKVRLSNGQGRNVIDRHFTLLLFFPLSFRIQISKPNMKSLGIMKATILCFHVKN